MDHEEKVLVQPAGRGPIVREVLGSEQTYYDHLKHHFLKVYRPCLEKMLGKEEVISRIISNVELLAEISERFLSGMRKALGSDGCVGQVYQSFADEFRAYAGYVVSHKEATRRLETLCKTSKELGAALEKCREACDGQNLQSLLIMPIQRVPRHVLLLRDVLKKTPRWHPDKKLCTKALDDIKAVATHLNESMREAEMSERLLEIQDCMHQRWLADGQRKLLFESELVKLNHHGAKELLAFFLLSDTVVYASKDSRRGRTGRLKYSFRGRVVPKRVVDLKAGTDTLSCAFLLEGEPKNLLLAAKDEPTKQAWLEHLSKLAPVVDDSAAAVVNGRAPQQDTTHHRFSLGWFGGRKRGTPQTPVDMGAANGAASNFGNLRSRFRHTSMPHRGQDTQLSAEAPEPARPRPASTFSPRRVRSASGAASGEAIAATRRSFVPNAEREHSTRESAAAGPQGGQATTRNEKPKPSARSARRRPKSIAAMPCGPPPPLPPLRPGGQQSTSYFPVSQDATSSSSRVSTDRHVASVGAIPSPVAEEDKAISGRALLVNATEEENPVVSPRELESKAPPRSCKSRPVPPPRPRVNRTPKQKPSSNGGTTALPSKVAPKVTARLTESHPRRVISSQRLAPSPSGRNDASRDGAGAARVLKPGGATVEEEAGLMTLAELRAAKASSRLGLKREELESHLVASEYEVAFGVSKESFAAMPAWRKIMLRKQAGIF